MKICYLILCHKNEKQVNSLIGQLDDKDVTFCVHIDKKAKLSIIQKNNIHFIEENSRIDIKWGDMGMITATLKLIKLAIENGPYDYVALISGQDFPIKTNEQIKSFLSLCDSRNYIDVNTSVNDEFKRMLKRIELYYPKWIQQRTFFTKTIKKLYILATGGCKYTFKPFRRKLPYDLKYAFGSQWWILTYECVMWMDLFVAQHAKLCEFFENALVPDECFFQILFINSPYAKTNEKNLTYIEWEVNRNHPRVLSKDDIPKLLQQPHFFARKFDVNDDPNVIDDLIVTINK